MRELDRAPFLFEPDDGRFHMIYAGALLPAGIACSIASWPACGSCRGGRPTLAGRLSVHFVGTGSSPDDPARPSGAAAGRSGWALTTWSTSIRSASAMSTRSTISTRSDAVLVLGSTEAHYTPSKVFQAMLSRRPVFAMLHKDSTAVDMIRSTRAGSVLTLDRGRRCPRRSRGRGGAAGAHRPTRRYDADAVDRAAFDAYSARGSTRALAEALDLACERAAAGRG